MKTWGFLFIAIIAEVIATSSLKSSMGFTKFWPSLLVLVGYGIAFYFLSLTLNTLSVGIAYAVWSGLGIVLVALFAWFVHQQRLDIWAVIGITLIISGVLVISLLSQSSAHN